MESDPIDCISILQDYYRNLLIVNGVGASVSSSSSLIETPDANNKLGNK